jgi:hypothetical protein
VEQPSPRRASEAAARQVSTPSFEIILIYLFFIAATTYAPEFTMQQQFSFTLTSLCSATEWNAFIFCKPFLRGTQSKEAQVRKAER